MSSEAYEIAMKAAETSRSWSVNDEERQRVLQSALSVYENAIQCAVNLKNYKQTTFQSFGGRCTKQKVVGFGGAKTAQLVRNCGELCTTEW